MDDRVRADVRFDPITDDEVPALIEHIVQDYARQKVEQGGWDEDDAAAAARKETAESFPEGRPRDGHEIYLVRGADQAPDAPDSGFLWVGALVSQPTLFFVFDIAIRPAARGRGWARAAMAFAEERARARGCTAVSLHVFGGNTAAITLYRDLGYEVTDLYLQKNLTD